MLLRVRHETVFDYSDEVSSSVMEVRLGPANHERQVLHSSSVEVTPRSRMFQYADYFGNTVHFFSVPIRHRRLAVVSHSVVQTLPLRPLSAPAIASSALWEYLQFGGPVARHHELASIADLFSGEPDLLKRLSALNHYLHERFSYSPQSTSVESTLADMLEGGSGVCQDFAHLMIGVCREMGVPARYVSGYIFTNRAPSVRGQDASHAWCECFILGAGWRGFDPTNDLLVDERYVEVARGRDYSDVPPTKGVYRGSATETMTVAVHTEAEPG
jgi:transglutaminase-like putative cysteine protease